MGKQHTSLAILVIAASWNQPAMAQTVRDSVGVRIVENDHPLWNPAERWRVAPAPQLEIGVESGDPMYEFASVWDIVRLDDGKLAVADRGATEVRVFTPSGEFVATFGGSGSGPGEFQDIGGLLLMPSGELGVIDGLQNRITFFDRPYQVSRTVQSQGAGTFFGQVEHRGFVSVRGSRGMGMADAGKVIRDSLRFALHDQEGRMLEELAVIPSAERFGFRFGGYLQFPYLPLAAQALYAAGRGVVAVGSGGREEFTVWSAATPSRSVVRWSSEDRREAADWIDAYVENLVANARSDNDRRYWRQLVREAPLPEYLPVYRDILVDSMGDVWVERYRAPGETIPTWEVFRGDGTWLGAVETPQRFQIMEIGADYLAGVFRGEFDVQYVRIYALVRP